jgi:putative phage-type endonuclease
MGIGSSDAPAILGVSRYKSAYQLYLEKLGVQAASKGESEQIRWGNILEEPIAQRYAEETGRSVRNPRVPGLFFLERSRTVEFMVASVDRYTLNPERPDDGEGVLEIKNAHFFVGKQWLDDQEPPLEFMVQHQHQLAVTGKRWGSIAAVIGGCRFVWADVPRDDEFIEKLIAVEAEFWQRLKDQRPPEPDGSDQTGAAIATLFRNESNAGQIIGLSPDYLDVHVELQTAKDQVDTWEEKKRAAENKIKLALGENTGGRLPNGVLYTWKTQTRKEHVVKASTFRVLRVTEPKRPELPAPGITVPSAALLEGVD